MCIETKNVNVKKFAVANTINMFVYGIKWEKSISSCVSI